MVVKAVMPERSQRVALQVFQRFLYDNYSCQILLSNSKTDDEHYKGSKDLCYQLAKAVDV